MPKDKATTGQAVTQHKARCVEPGYNIKVAARRTGLSAHVIRVWERRYGAVSPVRSATARRLYTEADIARLALLHQATLAGHSIGQIANLPVDRLTALIEADQAARVDGAWTPVAPGTGGEVSAAEFVARCHTAVEDLDADGLAVVLAQAGVALGQPAMLDQVVVPLMRHIGDCWRQGALRVSHEHLASAIIRTVLGDMLRRARGNAPGPVIVVTTPTGQLHEIGALIVAATAASEGWHVTYLGPNLPVEEIAAVALRTGARAVALSIIYPADDFRLQEELRKLRSFLSPGVAILIGGRAAEAYAPILEAVGAVKLDDMLSLRSHLEALRATPPPRRTVAKPARGKQPARL